MAEDPDNFTGGGDLSGSLDGAGAALDDIERALADVEQSARVFARSLTGALTDAIVGGKNFSGVVRSIALSFSKLALSSALKPLETLIARAAGSAFGALGAGDKTGPLTRLARGGIVGGPTVFGLGGTGRALIGEAGPEAVLPLSRGADGRLGVRATGAPAPRIDIHISTPDQESFQRAESEVTALLTRALARGRRGI